MNTISHPKTYSELVNKQWKSNTGHTKAIVVGVLYDRPDKVCIEWVVRFECLTLPLECELFDRQQPSCTHKHSGL